MGRLADENVDYSVRTAQNLMKVAREYTAENGDRIAGNVKTQAPAFLGLTQAIELLKVPGDERQEFIDAEVEEGISTRELEKKIKDLEEKNKELSGEVQTAKKENEEAGKQRAKDLELAKKQLDEAKRDIDSLSKKIKAYEEQPDVEDEEREKLKDKLAQTADRAERAEKKIKQLEQAATLNKSSESAEIKIRANAIIENFNGMMDALSQIKSNDMDLYQTLKEVPKNLIEKMKELIA